MNQTTFKLFSTLITFQKLWTHITIQQEKKLTQQKLQVQVYYHDLQLEHCSTLKNFQGGGSGGQKIFWGFRLGCQKFFLLHFVSFYGPFPENFLKILNNFFFGENFLPRKIF